MANQLIAIPFSPWSIKARWALDLRGVPYRYTEYVPMLGVPWLRYVTRRPRGKVSVPVLRTDGRVIAESYEIARYAEEHGSGPSLFPAGRDHEVAAWDRTGEQILAAGRTVGLRAALGDPGALREVLPPPLRKLPGATALARTGAAYVLRKYEVAGSDDALEAEMRDGLSALRDGLGGREYLLGEPSYADIAMAVALQVVSPPGGEYVSIGPNSRPMWTRDALAREFADLLAWRDAFYRRHHPARARARAA